MIDIGLNLTNGQFRNDAADVLRRAAEAGVSGCILTGTDVEGSEQSLALCRELGELWSGSLACTAGVHPHDADGFDDAARGRLRELLAQPEVVAVGETGLDFNRNYSTPENQQRAFAVQLDLAIETGKPLFLHERDAFDTQYAMLSERAGILPSGVQHCFTGSGDQLEKYLGLGLYVGITGWICDERRGAGLRDIIGRIPENRLLVETDAPFLLPHNIRPKPKSRRNEPMYLRWVVDKIAECTGRPADEIARSTTENALRLFRLTSAAQE